MLEVKVMSWSGENFSGRSPGTPVDTSTLGLASRNPPGSSSFSSL